MLLENEKQLRLPNKKELSKSLHSTNASSRRYSVQRWANFIAGFSIEFVESCINDVSPKQGIVLDPYAGCGTTLIAARNLGFKSIGFDPHILFAALCRAKIRNHEIKDVTTIANVFSKSKNSRSLSLSARTFLEKLFSQDNLNEILNASEGLTSIKENKRDLAVAIFLKACELSCTAQTDGVYKAPDSKKRAMSFKDSLKTSIDMFVEDINSNWYQEEWLNKPESTHVPESSEVLSGIEDESVCRVVTSPPYLNNFDYAEMTRMQLYLLGWADGWGDITEKVRSKLVTNTTTAIAGRRSEEYQNKEKSELPPSLSVELEQINIDLEAQRKVRPGKKPYSYLVFPYYAQISRTLKECHRTLQKGGRIHWVVSDAALYGVHISTEEHTAHLMREIGFSSVKVEKLRSRGERWVLDKRDGSKRGLGEYHIVGTK